MTLHSVEYDARAIKINGERTLLISGAIHYPRSTPAMWPELMRRSKEAGLNTIETYVFWNLHEKQRGIFDFSGRLDLYRFCEIAQEQGLSVILRIGPYICAETNFGGFPSWLRDVPGLQTRTYNETFMGEMERWVRHLVEYVRPLFAPNGGPIVLAQLENEYGMISSRYGETGQRYLQWVSDLGRDLQIGVPLIMCLGAAEGAIETINGFLAHYLIEDHFTRHPDQPAIWTENWPGWYDTFGYPHHLRTPEHVAYGVARFIAAGGTGVNYYMWHGGTNFGREGMYLQTASYDFNAPLNEFGQHTTKSQHLGCLHRLLLEHANSLLQQEKVEHQRQNDEQHSYSYGNGALVFLCNDAFEPRTSTYAAQNYEVAARSVLILHQGQVVFNTAEIAPESVISRNIEPAATTISSLTSYPEPLPAAWLEALRTATTVQTLQEQLTLTHDTTDYCWYTTRLQVPAGEEQGRLTLEGVADLVHIFVDGQLKATSPTPLVENRGALDGPHFTQSFSLELKAGEHELAILGCALGLIKGDWQIDANMVEERKGLWGQVRWNEQALTGPWTLQPGLVGEQVALFGTGGAIAQWNEDPQQAQGQPLRWWKLTFARPEGAEALVLDLSSMNKGLAWLNGQGLGRYWLTPGVGGLEEGWQGDAIQAGSGADEPTQRYYHLPVEWLREHNTVVLFEEMGGDASSIQICEVK